MAVAILKPFRRNNTPLFRGNIGAGGVSVFWPFRVGNSIVWRGKDCNGLVLYAWPFRRGNEILARTLYYECTSGDAGCCINGTCVNKPDRRSCEAAGGIWRGVGTPNPCACPSCACAPVVRPCCVGATCTMKTYADCTAAGGRWIYWEDDDATCADVVCQPASTACVCLFSPPVTQYLRFQLDDLGGIIDNGKSDCLNRCSSHTFDMSVYNNTYFLKRATNVGARCVYRVQWSHGFNPYTYPPIGLISQNWTPEPPCPARNDPGTAWSIEAEFSTVFVNGLPRLMCNVQGNFPANNTGVTTLYTGGPAACDATAFPLTVAANFDFPAAFVAGCLHLQYVTPGVKGIGFVEFAQSVPADWKAYLDLFA